MTVPPLSAYRVDAGCAPADPGAGRTRTPRTMTSNCDGRRRRHVGVEHRHGRAELGDRVGHFVAGAHHVATLRGLTRSLRRFQPDVGRLDHVAAMDVRILDRPGSRDRARASGADGFRAELDGRRAGRRRDRERAVVRSSSRAKLIGADAGSAFQPGASCSVTVAVDGPFSLFAIVTVMSRLNAGLQPSGCPPAEDGDPGSTLTSTRARR